MLERKTRGQVLACLPACLLAWCWQRRHFLCKFTENCFTIFDQSSHTILLTWYCQLYFFQWISCGYPLDGYVEDLFIKPVGEHYSILLHFCMPRQDFFFLFQSLDVRASEIFLMVMFLSGISCNKSLKTKTSHFFSCFF